MPHHVSREFDAQGNLVAEQFYREGNQDGRYRAWYTPTQLRYTLNFKQGLPTGNWKFYYESGQKLAEIRMSPSGLPQHYEFFDVDGTPQKVDNPAIWLQAQLKSKP